MKKNGDWDLNDRPQIIEKDNAIIKIKYCSELKKMASEGLNSFERLGWSLMPWIGFQSFVLRGRWKDFYRIKKSFGHFFLLSLISIQLKWGKIFAPFHLWWLKVFYIRTFKCSKSRTFFLYSKKEPIGSNCIMLKFLLLN